MIISPNGNGLVDVEEEEGGELVALAIFCFFAALGESEVGVDDETTEVGDRSSELVPSSNSLMKLSKSR